MYKQSNMTINRSKTKQSKQFSKQPPGKKNIKNQVDTLTPSTFSIVCLMGSNCSIGIAASTNSKTLIIGQQNMLNMEIHNETK